MSLNFYTKGGKKSRPKLQSNQLYVFPTCLLIFSLVCKYDYFQLKAKTYGEKNQVTLKFNLFWRKNERCYTIC